MEFTFRGVTRLNRMKLEIIREQLGVIKNIIECITSRRLKLFGHINRRPIDSSIYKAYKDNFVGPHPLGRPPKRWSDQIRTDTKLPLLTAEIKTKERNTWRAFTMDGARGVHA